MLFVDNIMEPILRSHALVYSPQTLKNKKEAEPANSIRERGGSMGQVGWVSLPTTKTAMYKCKECTHVKVTALQAPVLEAKELRETRTNLITSACPRVYCLLSNQ